MYLPLPCLYTYSLLSCLLHRIKFIIFASIVVLALLYDHLYNTVFGEMKCEDELAVGSSYADVGATVDGSCRNGVNMKFHEGEIQISLHFYLLFSP